MAGVRVASDKGLMALVVALLVMCGGGLAAAQNLVPAVYVFGDSTLDVGMNGPLPLPYGIDLPDDSLPTRVSNGFNLADYISRELGFENSPPAYESLKPHTSHQILRGFGGVSYASGGSGILNTTRIIVNTSISLAEQIDLFAATKLQMTQYARGKGSVAALDERLADSLFLISAGGNDFFIHIQSLCWRRCLPTFHANLLSNFTKHVQTLYGLGARRFGIVGVPPVGCVPLMRKFTLGGGCLVYANNITREFNTMVAEMMANFSTTDPAEPHNMTYSVGSAFNVLMNFTNDPVANGFTVVNSACCGDGRFGAGTFCVENATVCENRASHLYWDFAHSTQATAEKGAAIIFAAPVEEGFAAPINFQQLVSSKHDGSGGFSSA